MQDDVRGIAEPASDQPARDWAAAKDGLLNVICVNKGNYLGRGAEYVENLRDGVRRHLRGPFAFHVITDAPGEGWWAKISLFEPGRFKGRCLYFDLDTVIVGSLDHMAAYKGSFAALSDFYRPEALASGVMMWEAGEADHIYTRWIEAGMPQFHRFGDGGWIGEMMPQAARLQKLFPGQFVSLKAHCGDGVPYGARVVCFHGNPRPHMLADLMSNWTQNGERHAAVA